MVFGIKNLISVISASSNLNTTPTTLSPKNQDEARKHTTSGDRHADSEVPEEVRVQLNKKAWF